MLNEAESIIDLGLFSIQLTSSDNLDHFDIAVVKESKRPESACCAISGKLFSEEAVLTSLVPQQSIALSAVCMNIDQRALQDDSVRNGNDSPTYGIYNHTTKRTNKSSKVSCYEKNNPPSSIVVDDMDKMSKSSDNVENVYNRIHNV